MLGLVQLSIAVVLILLLIVRILKNATDLSGVLYFTLPLIIIVVPGTPTAPQLRLEEAIFIVFLGLQVLRMMHGGESNSYRTGTNAVMFVAYGYVIFFSFVFTVLSGTKEFDLLGLTLEISRILKLWLLIFWAATIEWNERSVLLALDTFVIVGVLASLTSVLQRINAFNINLYYSPLFLTPERLAQLEFRALGTLQNYNLFAVYLAIVCLIALNLLLFASRLWWRRLLYATALVLGFSTLVFTTSRGGLLSFFLGAGFVLITAAAHYGFSKRILLALVLGVACIAAIFGLQRIVGEVSTLGTLEEVRSGGSPLEYAMYRFLSITNSEYQLASITIRFSDWQKAIDDGLSSPIFGTGLPEWTEENTYYHSDYLLHFARYGIPGVLLLLFFISLPLQLVVKLRNLKLPRISEIDPVMLMSIYLSTGIAFAMSGILYQTFMQQRLTLVFFWLIGIGLAYWRRQKEPGSEGFGDSFERHLVQPTNITEIRLNSREHSA